MADISKHVPDCEDNRGERGERGHRGRRGYDGQDGAIGPIGPTGPAGPSTPLDYDQTTSVSFSLPTWNGHGFVQKRGAVGYLSLTALATAPFLAQDPVVAMLPVGFRPSQTLQGIPFYTALGSNQPGPIPKQGGTLDILTTGQITNLSIFVDPQNGEWFPLSIIMPMT